MGPRERHRGHASVHRDEGRLGRARRPDTRPVPNGLTREEEPQNDTVSEDPPHLRRRRGVDKAIEFYESAGIGPWHDYRPLTEFTDLDYPSVDAFHKLVYKWAMIGDLQLQLVEPGGGATPRRDFLDAHGPGVYHVGFVVDDADAAESEAAALGLRLKARGRRTDGTGFTYFDTRARSGVTLEIRQSPLKETAGSPARSASQPPPASGTTPFRTVHHMCVAVADIERAVAFYESVGIGPWQRLAPMNDVVELAGPSRDAFDDLAYTWTMIGDIQLQLVQPGAGRTPQGDFLTDRGEGVFHVGFAVESVDHAETEAAGLGLDVILRGRRADRSGFSYFDTYPKAGVTLQVREAAL
jgi:methylmalonyl-CoA/ethylmalonyl-CoA epimerase